MALNVGNREKRQPEKTGKRENRKPDGSATLESLRREFSDRIYRMNRMDELAGILHILFILSKMHGCLFDSLMLLLTRNPSTDLMKRERLFPNNAATQPPVAFGSRRLVAADVGAR